MSEQNTYRFPSLGAEPPHNRSVEFSLPKGWKKESYIAPEPNRLTRDGYTYRLSHKNSELSVTLIVETPGHHAQTRKWVRESQLRLRNGMTCTRSLGSGRGVVDDVLSLYPFRELGTLVLYCSYQVKEASVLQPIVTELFRTMTF